MMEKVYQEKRPRKLMLIIGVMIFLGFALMGQSATGMGQSVTGQVTASFLENPDHNQQTTISVEFENTLLSEALDIVSTKANAGISYQTDIVPEKRVNYRAVEKSALEILDELLAGTGLYATASEDRKVILVKKRLVNPQEMVQTGTINGTVTDAETGEPLPGTSILIEDTNIGASANAEGNFVLNDIEIGDYTLIATFVGYQQVEKEVVVRENEEATINFALTPTTSELGEMVVVGYGEQSKRNLVGSVSSVSEEDIDNVPVTNISDALTGKLPGLIGLKESGAPGSSTTLYIRGLSTTNNSSPLVVVDGIPGRSLDNLSQEEIESISVLKDASAIAVYGARAANGVIQVKTKKGRSGKPQISAEFNAGMQQQTNRLNYLNSAEYAELYNTALQNEGTYNPAVGQGYTEEEVELFRNGSQPDQYPNTNWYNEILSPNSMNQNFNISVSGGSENTTYFISSGYENEEGFYPVLDFQRYNIRSNIKSDITEDLQVNLNLAGYLSKGKDMAIFGNSYVISQALTSPPTRVNQFSNGFYNFVPAARGNAYSQSRGRNGTSENEDITFNGDISMDYELPFMEGLAVGGRMAYDVERGLSKEFATSYELYQRDDSGNFTQVTPFPSNPEIDQSNSYSESITLETSINYVQSFAKHHIDGLLLYTQTENGGGNFGTTRGNFTSDQLDIINAGDPTVVSNSGTEFNSARRGIVGRAKYNYDDKYLLEFNFRYDGSDKFAPGERYGFFPSVGLGWIISDESFFDSDFLNYLKIRGSYGVLGNDRINPYQYLSTFSLADLYGLGLYPAGYSFGGTDPTYYQGLEEDVLPNRGFTWERAIMTDIGIEGQILQKLSFEANYFYKKTDNILAPRAEAVPDVIGVGLPVENLARVDNKGFEFSMEYNDQTGDFAYTIAPNVTFARNEVVEFPQGTEIPERQRLEGKPVGLGAIVGYVADGLYQNQEDINNGPTPLYGNVAPGDIKYKDLNGDGAITSDDQKIISKGHYPEIVYGMNLRGSYRGFSLDLFLQGAARVESYVHGQMTFPFSYGGAPQEFHQDYWTPDNTDASFPRLFVNNQNNQEESSYWLENAAYIRLKSAQLSYRLPTGLVDKLGAQNVDIYLNGYNLLTLSALDRLDPQRTGSTAAYPLVRRFNAGIQLQF